jgi:peptidoglycan/xylan/chitin deacetylase (PgdA/CDA1 family)
MRFHRTPQPLQWLLPLFEWRGESEDKTIYLTFDDGPIPEVTEFVLESLQKHKAKATFFCVGQNVERHPHIASQVLKAGHTLGNHTHNHLSGWKSETRHYLRNTDQCQEALLTLAEFQPAQKPLFRPPYGQISLRQSMALRTMYKIVMWDVLTYDFDAKLAAEDCLQQSISATRPGSIVLFHDSLKARKNLEFALPKYLQHFSDLGYRFVSL